MHNFPFFCRLLFLRSSQYKSTPCKKVCVTGWMVVLPDDPDRPNIFQLNDPDRGQTKRTTKPEQLLLFQPLQMVSRGLSVSQEMFTSSRRGPGSPPSSGTKTWRRLVGVISPRYTRPSQETDFFCFFLKWSSDFGF